MMLLLVLAVPVKMFSCIFPSSLRTYVVYQESGQSC